jgi:hypothetical protein
VNRFGYEEVVTALNQGHIEHEIFPPLPEEEDARQVCNKKFVEINTHAGMHHQLIVEALDNAGLVYNDLPNDLSYRSRGRPQLSVLGITPGRILFKDVSYRKT